MQIYTLEWSNSDLKIIGPKNEKLEKKLVYIKKELVFNPKTYSRETRKSTVKVFNILSEKNGIVTYQTFQGLIDKVTSVLEKDKSNKIIVLDKRLPFPAPKLEAMYGFRFNQREKTETLLKACRSGILEAPTRYGKSVIITNIINAFPDVKTVVSAPGVDLLPQLEETIRKYCPEREVTGIYSGSKTQYMSDDITVCSMDSLHKLDKDSVKLLLIDEPHSAVSESRAQEFCKFHNARIYGFGATVSGRYTGNDIMIEGIIGPTLSKITFQEAVNIGALCPIEVKVIKVPFTPQGYKNRNTAYKHYVYNNPEFLNRIKHIANNIVPEEFQTLLFIDNEAEAKGIQPLINNSELAMDKLFDNKKARSEMFERLKNDEVKRCICSNIYSTGVTIDNIRCVINCCGGGGSILSVQKPGRLAEIKPGKRCGYLIDYQLVPTSNSGSSIDFMLVNDCKARFKVYAEKGYKIDYYDNPEDISLD
jgi:superfamily II DNA or RNA helicase